MKKKAILVFAVMLLMSFSLFACGDKVVKHTVQFMDDANVIKTVEVEDGKKAEKYTPTKAGYEFVDWFSTPSRNIRYSFDKEIKEDTKIFAGFTKFKEDTREFAIVGSGTSKLMFLSNWGKTINTEHKMAKAASKNEYTLTLDLNKGDEFQFAINTSWHNKRGYGYFTSEKLADGTVAFSSAGGGIGETTAKGSNTKVELAGNYTFTLKTYPSDDTYAKTDPAYTEATKEVFNVGTYDSISWVRNGDVLEVPEVIVDYYIKGAKITDWKDAYNPATKFNNNKGVYTLQTYLKEAEEFMFTSTNTILGQRTAGTIFIRYNALDENGKNLFTATKSFNLVAKATGTYTFTYTESTKVLSAVLDATTTPEKRDYYIDGTFAGEWGDTLYGAKVERVEGSLTVGDKKSYLFKDGANNGFKLRETAVDSGVYKLSGVTLPAGKEIMIQSYKAGALEPGLWGTPDYKALGTLNYAYLALPNEAFEAVSGTNLNIKIKTAGVYDISYNSYSHILQISASI